MSSGAASSASAQRLLTFEVGASLYALPIAHVLEVAEVAEVVGVPTLPVSTGGSF